MVFSFSWVEQVRTYDDRYIYFYIIVFWYTFYQSMTSAQEWKNKKVLSERKKASKTSRVESNDWQWRAVWKIFMDKGVELNFARTLEIRFFSPNWKTLKMLEKFHCPFKVLKSSFFALFWFCSLEWRKVQVKCCNIKTNFVFFTQY